MKFLNRLLYQVHRWLGVVLALFMFFWFFTGLVIMYSKSTAQNRSQQLAHAETLAPEVGWLSLGGAWELSAVQRKAAAKSSVKSADAGANRSIDSSGSGRIGGEGDNTIADARLVRSAGQPYWLVEDSRGLRFALSALDGSVHETSPDEARKIAENWSDAAADGGIKKARYLETLQKPIILRNQTALSPFHRIELGNDGDELLISVRTGEVLHASTRMDRAFFWAGNWLHLFKPLESVGFGHIRNDVQLWLGLFATIGTLTGLIIGWLRWRPGFRGKPTYSEGRTQPYREVWLKWHFWSGLLGGTVALSWGISGFVDTNPGKIFSEANPSRKEIIQYFGNEMPLSLRNWQPVLPVLQALAVDGSDIVEMSWRRLGSEAVLLAYTRSGQRLPQTMDGVSPQFKTTSLLAAVDRMDGKAKVETQTVLDDYDSYYYPRHREGLVEKPLPVLMVQLADETGTRFYLDPQDGRLLAKMDRSRRVFRWLYSGLHHWDFGWLYRRPLWDAWMLTWVSFGLVLGSSSLVVGWRLLNKTFVPKKRKGSSRRPPSRRYLSGSHQH